MSKIIYFSTAPYDKFKVSKEHEEILEESTIIKGKKKHLKLLSQEKEVQLDVETTYTDRLYTRKITVVQMGSFDGSTQYIFDIPRLTNFEKKVLFAMLRDQDIIWYIHNAMFEYTIIKHDFGIELVNLRDTYVQAKLLTNDINLPKGYNGLAGIVNREFGYFLDKGQQLSFDGTELDYDQFIYAVLDVVFITAIHDIQEKDVKYWKMYRVYRLECEVIKALGDMQVNGMLFDFDYHKRVTVTKFEKIYAERMDHMIEIIKNDPKLVAYLEEKEYINKNDKYLFKWTSPKVNKSLIKLVIPELDTTNRQVLKKFLKDNEHLTIEQVTFLNKYIDKDTDWLETFFISKHHDEMVKLDLFIPEGKFMLNFNSSDQVLYLFKYWYPDLQNTNAKTVARMTKGILKDYKKFKQAAKMLSSFGEVMNKYKDSDGRIRTSFKQMVSTGRLSSSKPNLQQMPSTNEFRNAYYSAEGYSFVGLDFSSQEILIAAQASGDENYWEAIKKGYDLHSYSAYLIHGQKWLDAGGSAEPIGKPKTPEANAMRKSSKSLSFGLFYGSSARAIGETLNISRKEAQEMMDKYFKTFPKLASYFDRQNRYGKKHKYARGLPPFNRVRFFDNPNNKGELEAVGRQAQNFGIQGTAADITKLAMVYIIKYIYKHELKDKVKISLQVHDEIICEVVDDYANEWLNIQRVLMEKAGSVIIPGNWLKATGEVSKVWIK